MFKDRKDAGRCLAAALNGFEKLNPIVYALPRGGVPVAAVIAKKLGAPLDFILVRKIAAPRSAELAIGALVDGAEPTILLHDETINALKVDEAYIKAAKLAAIAEIERRRAAFRSACKALSPQGKNVILVDDGLATGATMQAAVAAMRKAGAGRITVAIPVAPSEAAATFRQLADDFICVETPSAFWAVGNHYRSFPQLEDRDVIEMLAEFGAPPVAG